MFSNKIPTTSKIVALAITPGLLAVIGFTTFDFSPKMLICIGLLVLYVLSAFLWNKKQLPSWCLMAVGILVSFGLFILVGIIGGLISILAGKMVDVSLAIFLWVTLFVLLITFFRKQTVPRNTLLLISLITFFQLLMRVKYFILFGVSWNIAIEWFAVSMYSSAIALLLPIIIALPLIRKHGKWSILYGIGSVFMGFQQLIDIYQKVSDQIGGTFWFFAYKLIIPLLFIVLATLWFFLVKKDRFRFTGLLIWVGFAVTTDIVIVGISYQELPLIIWLSSIPYTLSVLLTLMLINQLSVFFQKTDLLHKVGVQNTV
jgi:hypothetical protein